MNAAQYADTNETCTSFRNKSIGTRWTTPRLWTVGQDYIQSNIDITRYILPMWLKVDVSWLAHMGGAWASPVSLLLTNVCHFQWICSMSLCLCNWSRYIGIRQWIRWCICNQWMMWFWWISTCQAVTPTDSHLQIHLSPKDGQRQIYSKLPL